MVHNTYAVSYKSVDSPEFEMLLIELANAFNVIGRKFIMSEVQRRMTEILS